MCFQGVQKDCRELEAWTFLKSIATTVVVADQGYAEPTKPTSAAFVALGF